MVPSGSLLHQKTFIFEIRLKITLRPLTRGSKMLRLFRDFGSRSEIYFSGYLILVVI